MSDSIKSRNPSPSLILTVLGAFSLIGGAVAVFVTTNGAGAAAMLTAGVVLILVGVLGDRLEGLEFGSAKLQLRAAAAEKYEAAEAFELSGDSAAAEALRSQARTLLEAADPLAARYASTRAAMRPGPERTLAMEDVVRDARRRAAVGDIGRDAVLEWLRTGNDEKRIVALSMMQAQKGLRDFELMLDAIARPHSAFEQYHAILLADKMVDELDADQRRRLSECLADQLREGRVKHDTDRRILSNRVIKRLQDASAQE